MRKKTIVNSLTASRLYSGKVKRTRTRLDELTTEADKLGLSYGRYKQLLSVPELLKEVMEQRGIKAGAGESVEELRERIREI